MSSSTLWDSLFLSDHIITMNSPHDYGILAQGAIGVKEGRIVWLGEQQSLTKSYDQYARQVVDYQQAWLTPGLIDCHTHLVYGGQRANEFALRLEGASYADIALSGGGIVSTVKATRAASDATLLHKASQRLLSLQREGVSTVEIKSGYGLDLATECRMLRLARQLQQQCPVTIRTSFLGAHALPAEFEQADDYIRFVCEKALPAVAKEQLADAVDVFCESIGFNLSQTEQVFQAAQRHGLAIKCHAEQLTDMGASQLAANYQALSVDHIEHISLESIKALAQAGTVAVLLPGAYYTLQEKQKPPIELLREYGVPMAVATDCNPGSSPVGSLLLMLNMACILFRLTPFEALAGVTKQAAKALGLAASHGTLAVGKMADIAVWDIEHPAELAYYAGYNPCQQLIKAGQIVSLSE